jgi:hypothetical protein
MEAGMNLHLATTVLLRKVTEMEQEIRHLQVLSDWKTNRIEDLEGKVSAMEKTKTVKPN